MTAISGNGGAMTKIADSIERYIKRQSVSFLILAILAGLLMILVGVLLRPVSPMTYEIVLPFGSSILGVAIGMAFGSLFDATHLHQIKTLLHNTLQSSIYSADDVLDFYRRPMHHYFRTVTDGVAVWRYRVYNFDLIETPGKLTCAISVDRPSGQGTVVYRIEGFVSAQRLILVQRASAGAEPPIVQVFPHGGDQFRTKFAGTSLLKSWDGDDLIVPSLLSQTPLTSVPVPVGSVPEAENARLYGEWQKNFGRIVVDLGPESRVP